MDRDWEVEIPVGTTGEMLKEKPLNQRMKIPLEGETEARDRAGTGTHPLTAMVILLGTALPRLYLLFLVGDAQNAGVGW